MLLIGEKINGSIPVVGEAIRGKNDELIRQRARLQASAGADFLDVCASVEMEAEDAALRWLIDIVQEETDLPLSIDSPNPRACVNAMARCRRPGIINSVSMEGDKLSVVFPAIMNTSWGCIALLSDDRGIPDSAQGRLRVLDQIMARAETYGIAQERLFVDPLVVTLSANPQALTTFVTCCQAIRAKYPGVHITSGLSNISFGLPGRKYLNQAFLLLARNAGMDSAILDPANSDLRNLLAAAEALLGGDPYCQGYIQRFTQKGDDAPSTLPVSSAKEPVLSVGLAVEKGRIEEIQGAVDAALLSGIPAKVILRDGMIEAMNKLGEQFSQGTAFVPQLLMAARVMKKGVSLLRPLMGGEGDGRLGRVVIGTVAGDQHDIGKNLVAMMLESAGFDVLDLGADVPPERFIEATEDVNTRIVALSALLTTTLPAMKDTVGALNTLPTRNRFFVMVGGAPVSEKFAMEIGADAYSEDAGAATAKARLLVTHGKKGGNQP